MRMRTILMWSCALGLGLGASACGKKGGESGAPGAAGGAALEVSADSVAFKFHPETLEAPAGQPINVELKNPSQQPHTWVLVKPGDEEKVDQAAQASGGDARNVAGTIKASSVVSAGGSETIAVGSLEPGTYSYICTYPGHLAGGMKGTLTVK